MRELSFFECCRCGACCRWEGPVRISPQEIRRIADFFGIPEQEFINQHTVLAPDRKSLSLKEKPDGSCVYFQENPCRCLIQSVKPDQCKDFPRKWNFPGWEKFCAGKKEFIHNS